MAANENVQATIPEVSAPVCTGEIPSGSTAQPSSSSVVGHYVREYLSSSSFRRHELDHRF